MEMVKQILWYDILVSIPFAFLRFVAIVDGLRGADVEAAEAVHATMLPNGMTVRARDVLARANLLAQAAGDTGACVAEKLFVKLLLRRFPVFMDSTAGRSENLPCGVRIAMIYG